ncbi:hypothetical protein COY06_02390 [Candidatus Peregrinibacteria bacterium CG_4_10_14_0_2_um_filter_41_8]|nr:MAG: hypothetical protein COY06_02390 [Candidatus Peregrinibacteria bacterium CG_4_10_14_0_2_um_filter_41_8]
MLYNLLDNIDFSIEIAATVVGYIAVLVIIGGLIHGLVILVKHLLNPKQFPFTVVRLVVGQYLLLGLEFLIAKDILQSVLQPTISELTQLGILVLIRIVLNFFLEFDLVGKHKFLNNLFRK